MTNLTDNNDLKLQEARKIAQGAIAETVPLLLACCQIYALIRNLEVLPTDTLDMLNGISSECDGLPIGSERQYWEAAALAVKDKQIAKYTAHVREDVLLAFKQLTETQKNQ